MDNGLILQLPKCNIIKPEVDFLGFTISKEGVRPIKRSVNVINKIPYPSTIKELRAILGKFNYYKHYIRNFANIAAPLTNLLQGHDSKLKHTEMILDKGAREAVDILKQKLISAPILSIPDWYGEPFHLYTDSSSNAIGVVITQEQNQTEKVLLFDSKKLNKAQMKYDINKKEMLALIFALERHKYLLWPRRFIFHTDNAALSYIKSIKQTKGILARWIGIISSYNFDAYHKAGKT